MNRTTRCLLGLSALALSAVSAFWMPGEPPREPLDERSWAVDSVMLLDEAATTGYNLDPPFRIVRGGEVTLTRRVKTPALPVVRVDLTVNGEHVTVFSRLSQNE